MKKSYQYILFDWDGNIAKTLDIWLAALRVVLARYGVERTDYDLARSFGQWREYCAHDWKLDYDTVIDEIDQYGGQSLAAVELYPGAIDVISELYDRGKNLALITSSPHANASLLLEKYDLMRYFETIVAYDDTTHHKPHPEPLEKALAAMGGDKSHAIMIGDSDKDLGAAQNFGCDSILFYPPEHEKFYDHSELQGYNPTITVSQFQEITRLVR